MKKTHAFGFASLITFIILLLLLIFSFEMFHMELL
ncbi:hypothetical protein A7H1H_0803 [Aliarcobacter butzleri 7h1h]|nr:hypothetical protein A7H1H_0803 [Aliarcobacter butzleri 7h1h]